MAIKRKAIKERIKQLKDNIKMWEEEIRLEKKEKEVDTNYLDLVYKHIFKEKTDLKEFEKMLKGR